MESTTTPAASISSVAVRYGLLAGLVSIIFMVLTFVTGQEANTALQYAGLIIPIVAVVLAHKAFKQANGGFMGYGEGVGLGTLLMLVSGTLGAIFRYVYTTFIDPEVQARLIETMRAKFEAQGMQDAQIEQAIGMANKFSSGPIGVVIGLISAAIAGVIISLIVSAFTKNAKPEFE